MKRWLPTFVAEMEGPQYRAGLEWSIRTGYLFPLLFAAILFLADHVSLLPISWIMVGALALKLIVNTCTWAALRADRLVLPLVIANLAADIVAMTAAIYATGGARSPVVLIYGVALMMVALLSNPSATILTGAITVICYGLMLLLVRLGVLPKPPGILVIDQSANDAYHVLTFLFVCLAIGIPTGFAATIVHRLREHRRALLRKADELVEAGRARSQFMANITHELRTPIHGISGLADLLEAGIYGPVSAKQRDAARDIKGSAQALLRLIDDLLTLAREDAGRLEYRASQVDLDELLTSVMATVQFLRGTRDLDVRLEAEPQLPQIETDRGKLVQILVNLLANAVKFTPDGGHVLLRARRHGGDHVELAVIDDGIGIAGEDLERVFQPFEQGDGSDERRYGGAGLGLALAIRLIELLGAELSVSTAKGEGSTFAVLVPIVRVGANAA